MGFFARASAGFEVASRKSDDEKEEKKSLTEEKPTGKEKEPEKKAPTEEKPVEQEKKPEKESPTVGWQWQDTVCQLMDNARL